MGRGSTGSLQLHILLPTSVALLLLVVSTCLLHYSQGMEIATPGAEVLTEEELAYLGEDGDDGADFPDHGSEDEHGSRGAADHGSESNIAARFGEEEENEEVGEVNEKDVVILDAGNFSDFVKSNLFVLVEFYAPWCGHCKALVPEYAEAASILQGQIVLAKVDATTNSELAEQYEIENFPTLMFFFEGRAKTYYVGRTRDEIVSWVTRKIGPRVARLSSWKDAETVLHSLKATMAVALFDKVEGPESIEFTRAARLVDGIYFFETDDVEAATIFKFPDNATRPALVLLKQEQEKVSWFDGPFERDAIETFLEKNKLPFVTTFNKETAVPLFDSSVKKQIILLASAKDYRKLIRGFREAAKALRDRLVFVYADLDDAEQAPGILEFFGTPSDKPSVVGYDTEDVSHKYVLQAEISEENVKAFGESFLSGELQPQVKSDPIPEATDSESEVKVVVGANFDEIVLDERRDVFLEVYAPWCGHCQELQPKWETLAAKLRGVESILIAKMDGTTNEHKKVQVEGFPTLLLFPAGKADREPVMFEGKRTVRDFVRFLRRESNISFSLPGYPKDDSKTADIVDIEDYYNHNLNDLKDEL